MAKNQPNSDAGSKTELTATAPSGALGIDLPTLEGWLWEAASAIRGPVDAPKFRDYILPLIFLKRLSDVFEDEITYLIADLGPREKTISIVEADHKLVRFFIPPVARWAEIARRTTALGEYLTDALRSVARENLQLSGVIDVMDFNATTSGQRILGDDRLADLIAILNRHRLGLRDVEPDLFGRAYEYLLRKFAEGSGSSAGEFFTPPEVAYLMARILDPEPGQTVYDPCCGSGGLLIKAHLRLLEKCGRSTNGSRRLPSAIAPLRLFGQDIGVEKFAMTRMNAVVHDMEARVALRDTMAQPAFTRSDGSLRRFDLITANPMWNQDFSSKTYESDTFGRFGFGIPPSSTADWGWIQHMFASLQPGGRITVVLDTNAVSRGSGSKTKNRERDIRKAFVERGLIDTVILLPENLFYNTGAPGIILVIDASRSQADPIRLINASQLYGRRGPKNYLRDTDIDAVAEAMQASNDIEDLSRIVDIAVVRDLDYDLSPSRHVPLDPEIPSVPLPSALQSVQESHVRLRAAVDQRIGSLTPFARLAVRAGLPTGWRCASLASLVAERLSGDWGVEFPRDDHDYVRCAVIRGTDFPNVSRGRLAGVPYRYVKDKVLNARGPRPGDVLVEMSGGGKYQNTGRALYVSDELIANADPPLMFTNFTKLLRFIPDVVPKYLYYCWSLLYDLGRTATYEKQPTNIKNFKLEDFLRHETVVFPVDRGAQTRVVEALDSIHDEIAAVDALRANLLSVRHGALKELLTGSLAAGRKANAKETH